jgi:cyanophycinase
MSPKLVLANVDTYIKNTNISTEIGAQNLKIILQSDLVFFNGGDQSRHSRTWNYDNGLPNDIMTRIIERALKKEITLIGTSAGSMAMS